MIMRARVLWLILMVAPASYVQVAFPISSGSSGLGSTDVGSIQLLFLGLLVLSASNLVFVTFTQTSKRFQPSLASKDPIGWVFQTLAIGSILSEALAVYGLVLTLVSGSLAHVVAFSLASWASLIWVGTRFTRNLRRLP